MFKESKISKKNARRTKIALLSFLSIAACFLIFYLQNELRTTSFLSITFPQDEILSITFDGSFENKTLPSNKESDLFFFKGYVEGKPKHLEEGCVYECRFLSWHLFNRDKRLLLGFERLKDGSIAFFHDPLLYSGEKKEILDIFEVDTSNNIASSDHSLINLPFSFYWSQKGNIEEIILSQATKNALATWTNSMYGGEFWKHLLSNPEEFPPLFPSKRISVEKLNVWNTSGTLINNLVHVKKEEDSVWHVTTTTLHPQISLKINWDFFPRSHLISKAHIELGHTTKQKALSLKTGTQTLILNCVFDWNLKQSALNEVPLFD